MPTLLSLPAAEADVRALRAGEVVRVRGVVLTARLAALRHLLAEEDPAFRAWAAGAGLYHCSPVVTRAGAGAPWRVAAAGPSSSPPLEPWTCAALERYGLRAVIGWGGLGPRGRGVLRRAGAVYLHATPDLAVTLARRITAVRGVHLADALGVAEAVWRLEVEDLPATVTMDAEGGSLHERQHDPP